MPNNNRQLRISLRLSNQRSQQFCNRISNSGVMVVAEKRKGISDETRVETNNSSSRSNSNKTIPQITRPMKQNRQPKTQPPVMTLTNRQQRHRSNNRIQVASTAADPCRRTPSRICASIIMAGRPRIMASWLMQLTQKAKKRP